ncbi:NAD-dependent epimerase/dehydratase family protein [Natronoglomus mannanivorans]|uniref:NAD-dependent epimerase/dehydratase family protein n=1 Tax=Natronoglomus mannanivorans TaxID=2979990 RepID=A0AAP2Z0L4_9EURY|nr:NAD-dependent epimerase/dehydratase family protein [Halobacteria archaeon AArc-xg1-1]
MTGTAPTAAVTGATGFIGTHLCGRLLADGWTIRGLCRPGSNRGDRRAPLEWTVGDITDREALESLVDGVDAVFHLAGVGLWRADPETVHRVNREGTRAVLEACRSRSVGRLVFTSTAGTRRVTGQEPAWSSAAVADETDVADPVGAYQSSKAAAERLVDSYVDSGGDAVTVHPTAVFGPGDERFTARLLELALDPKRLAAPPGGGSLVGVSDVVDGTLAALEEGGAGEHYLLGGENLTYGAATVRVARHTDGHPPRFRVPAAAIRAAGPVAGAVGRVTGVRVFPFDRDMARLATRHLFYSSRKAHEELGYTYDPLEAHLPETLAWYRSSG